MSMTKRERTGALLLLAALAAVLCAWAVFAVPTRAGATTTAPSGPSSASSAPAGCAFAAGLSAGTITTVAGGKATTKGDAIEFITAVNEDATTWKIALAVPVKLASVTGASYAAIKDDKAGAGVNDAAMPAYRFYLDNGKTLYFEPYYQVTGNPERDAWKTWDVAAGKLWQTGEGGGSYAGNRTLSEFKALYPTAKVTHVGIGQGTYNAGTVGRFKAVKLAATDPCTVAPAPSGSSKAPQPVPSRSSSAPAVVPADSLPVTGAKMPVLLGAGVGMVLLGVAGVLLARRRRIRWGA